MKLRQWAISLVRTIVSYVVVYALQKWGIEIDAEFQAEFVLVAGGVLYGGLRALEETLSSRYPWIQRVLGLGFGTTPAYPNTRAYPNS